MSAGNGTLGGPAPRVSIGLPVYNGARYLAVTIDAVLAQTFGDFELIISDNTSTDATEEICRRYAKRDSRVRYFRSDVNRGMTWNLNRTFELARGEYFKWLCDDDQCAPTLIERCVDVLDRHPQFVLCTSLAEVIDEHGDPVVSDGLPLRCEREHAVRRRLDSQQPHQRLETLLLYSVWVPEEFGLIRADRLRRTKLQRPYVGSEKVMLAEMLMTGPAYEIPEPLLFIRHHPDRCALMPPGMAQFLYLGRDRRWSVPPAIRCAIGHLGVVLSAPLRSWQRCRCVGVVLRYVFQAKKWKTKIRYGLQFFGLIGRTEVQASHREKARGNQVTAGPRRSNPTESDAGVLRDNYAVSATAQDQFQPSAQ